VPAFDTISEQANRASEIYCPRLGRPIGEGFLSVGFISRAFVATLVAVAAIAYAPTIALGIPPVPIPEGPEASSVPVFFGSTAIPHKVSPFYVPRHPLMAPNGRSNIHNDAYQTDTYVGAGPRGREMERLSTFLGGECGSLTFDRGGRIESVCVGLDGPRLALFDPHTLELLTAFPLPPRTPSTSGGNPFTDFSGGGYFYLDQEDRAVIPTTTRHIWVIGQAANVSGPLFMMERDYDVSSAVPAGDGIISAMPDWSGRIWFVSGTGVVGVIDPASGSFSAVSLGERIGNSFAVDETGGVFIVTDAAMYRFDAGPGGSPSISWRETYANIGVRKPGQTEAGSGTTPTLMGTQFVAITDNADPMDVVVYRRGRDVTGSRVVCTQPVFSAGASSTDQSLIGTSRTMIVENNYGYTGPTTSTMNGATTTPGIERVDINDDQSGCHTVWHNNESAPSVVPKLSRANGLVYSYTKPQDPNQTDVWYFTAIDYRTGRTVYKRLAGTGLGFNNNFAPVSLGPDGSTAYVGALGGLVLLRDP
jgi:hypothetical protein